MQNTVFQLNKASLHIVDASLMCPSVHVKEQLLHSAMHMPRPCKWRQLYILADVIHRGVIERRSGNFLLKFIITREKTSDIEKGIFAPE